MTSASRGRRRYSLNLPTPVSGSGSIPLTKPKLTSVDLMSTGCWTNGADAATPGTRETSFEISSQSVRPKPSILTVM